MKVDRDNFVTIRVHVSELPPEVFDDSALIDERLTAKILGCSVGLLQNHRRHGKGLPYRKDPAGMIRYRRGDVRAEVERHIQQTTHSAA